MCVIAGVTRGHVFVDLWATPPMLQMDAFEVAVMVSQLKGSDYISVVSAILAAGFAYLSQLQAKRSAQTSLNLAGQNLLLDANKLLIANPLLGAIFDDDPVRTTEAYARVKGTPEFRIQMEAFADILLNMFDVVLAEYRGVTLPIYKLMLVEAETTTLQQTVQGDSGAALKTWVLFFFDVVEHSSLVRERLRRREGVSLYRPTLRNYFAEWEKRQAENLEH